MTNRYYRLNFYKQFVCRKIHYFFGRCRPAMIIPISINLVSINLGNSIKVFCNLKHQIQWVKDSLALREGSYASDVYHAWCIPRYDGAGAMFPQFHLEPLAYVRHDKVPKQHPNGAKAIQPPANEYYR